MRIGICDDEKEIRHTFAEKIRRIYPKAELEQYPSGEELLSADRMPDILLLDIRMPGRDGMETAKKLREKGGETVIIFVTAL